MWITLIFITLIIVFILILVLIAFKETTTIKTIKCKYCGHEFRYSESRVVDYKLNGRLQKAQECPRCGKYTEIQ
jgi:transcription elongation factor Elf1